MASEITDHAKFAVKNHTSDKQFTVGLFSNNEARVMSK